MKKVFTKISVEVDDWGRVSTCVVDGIKGKRNYTGNRRVFIFKGKFVIKFDSSNRGFGYQNLREVKNFKKIAEEDKQYFAPIMQTGKIKGRFYVVQEYVPSTRKPNNKDYETLNWLRAKYALSDVGLSDVSKNHHNIALTKKEFKIFDLGYEASFFPRARVKNVQQALFQG